MTNRERICRRLALEFKDGDYVNLGIGMPTEVVNFLPEDINIFTQAECGLLGCGPNPKPGEEDPHIIDAGGRLVTAIPGASYFDSSISFLMIRGGHIDVTVLGALEVDQEGSIANWMIPGVMVPGMGGAMDLAAGARRLIVIMEHTNKHGKSKLLKKCTLPLTASKKVNRIITELGVFDITEKGMVLREITEGVTLDQVLAATEADLIIEGEPKIMPLNQ